MSRKNQDKDIRIEILRDKHFASRMYSTANENHRSVCHNVDILHPRMLIFLAHNRLTNGRQEPVITDARPNLVTK